MKLSLQLSDLLQQHDAAISASSTFIAQGMAQIECTGVDAIEPEKLELLCSAIPENWGQPELEQAFDLSTATSTLRKQLLQRIVGEIEQPKETQPHTKLINVCYT